MMKLVFGLSMIGFSILTSACGQEIRGTISVEDGEKLELKDTQGRKVQIVTGAASVWIAEPSLLSPATITLKTSQRSVKLSLPASKIQSVTEFSLPEKETGQPVSVIGKKRLRYLEFHDIEATHSCTYYGFCSNCPHSDLNGRCGLKHKSICLGAKRTMDRVATLEEGYHVEFRKSGTIVAEFVSTPTVTSKTTMSKDISVCQEIKSK